MRLVPFVWLFALLLALAGCGGRRFASEEEYRAARTKSLVAKEGTKQTLQRDGDTYYLWVLESRQAVLDTVRIVDGTFTLVESVPFSNANEARDWLAREERKGKGTENPVSAVRQRRLSELGAVSTSLVGTSPGGPLYGYVLPTNDVVVDIPEADGAGGIKVTSSQQFANILDAQKEFAWLPNQQEWIGRRSGELEATLDWARTLTSFQLFGWRLPDGSYRLDIADADSSEGVLVKRTMTFASVDELSVYVDEALVRKDLTWEGVIQYSKRGFMLIGTVLIISFFIVFNIARARGAKGLTIRRIAGLDQIDEAIGRATETARPVLMVPGIGALDGISVQALTIFGSVIRSAARFATPIRLLTANPAVFGVAQEIARDVYLSEGVPEQFDADSVRFVSDRQFAFASGVAGIIQRERVAAAFFMGEFFAESLIFAENANIVGAIQVAASTQTTQTPFFIAACDYVLLGDEFYAASAYLGRQPVLLGSLVGVDWAKMLFMLFIVIAVVKHSFDQLRPLNVEAMPVEQREQLARINQQYVDYRQDAWFIKMTKERRQ